MKFLLATALATALLAAAAPARANAFQCTNDGGHKVGVDLDAGGRLLTVSREDGVVDRGFYVERTIPEAAYLEYYMPNDSYSDAYYLRVWKDADRAEFQYCWGCAVFVCDHADPFRGS